MTRRPLTRALLAAAAAIGMGLCAGPGTRAQERMEPPPKALENVGIDEKTDAALPLERTFTDEDGREVSLGRYFRTGRPVILTLNYYRCPMLCTLELNGLTDALRGLSWAPGDRFDVVTVSIDPREMPPLALEKKRTYLAVLNRPGAEGGWHFLTGSAASIEALTSAVGFRYAYDADTDQFGHAAAIVLATPEGRVSRYLYGVQYDPSTLRLALLEASKGRIGSALDRFILYCYHYDPNQGRYALAAETIMRLGGTLAVFALGATLSGLWLREWRLHRAARAAGPERT